MKIKQNVLKLVMCFYIISGFSNFQKEDPAIKKISSFYKEYIILNSKQKVDFKMINKLKKANCSIRLLNKLDKMSLDYDPFLKAQDCDSAWLNTLAVSKTNQINVYDVSYVDNYSKSKVIIKIYISPSTPLLIDNIFL